MGGQTIAVTAQVGGVPTSFQQVGTYTNANQNNSGGAGAGQTRTSAQLISVSGGGYFRGFAGINTGTWRCMGGNRYYYDPEGSSFYSPGTFVRIS